LSVKDNSQRIFILVIVAVFFLTSLATTGYVLYDSLKKKDTTAGAGADTQKKIAALQNDVTKSKTSQEGKLEGTKLANFTPVTDVPTLQKIDTVPGTGDEVKPGATVTAHYTGAVAATGVIFQSSKDTGQPVPFGLSQVIKGWTDGVPGMKVGGTRRLIIPADQAYGANPPQGSNIPPNAALVFDIELVSVQQ
jgi:FKBP-type peptidyl-prolyl cis-trans isomerase